MNILSITFDNEAKNAQWGKDSLFKKWYLKNYLNNMQRNKTGAYLKLFTKINSKLIKDLNIRPNSIKLLRKHKEEAP